MGRLTHIAFDAGAFAIAASSFRFVAFCPEDAVSRPIRCESIPRITCTHLRCLQKSQLKMALGALLVGEFVRTTLGSTSAKLDGVLRFDSWSGEGEELWTLETEPSIE